MGKLAERTAQHFLVQLGKLAAKRRLPLSAKRAAKIGKRLLYFMRSLIEYQCVRKILNDFKSLGAFLFRHGQKPFEHPSVDLQTACRDRSDRRVAPRYDFHRDTALIALGNKHGAGVGNAGHTRVRNHSYIVSVKKQFYYVFAFFLFFGFIA